MKIKEIMPDKAKIVFVVFERLGIPTVLCLVFGWLYFTKLQKVIDDVASFRIDVKIISELSKADHEEIKREMRRLSFRRG